MPWRVKYESEIVLSSPHSRRMLTVCNEISRSALLMDEEGVHWFASLILIFLPDVLPLLHARGQFAPLTLVFHHLCHQLLPLFCCSLFRVIFGVLDQ